MAAALVEERRAAMLVIDGRGLAADREMANVTMLDDVRSHLDDLGRGWRHRHNQQDREDARTHGAG